MNFTYSITEKEFVEEVRTWLEEHIVGEFVSLRGKGLTGHDDVPAELQIAVSYTHLTLPTSHLV